MSWSISSCYNTGCTTSIERYVTHETQDTGNTNVDTEAWFVEISKFQYRLTFQEGRSGYQLCVLHTSALKSLLTVLNYFYENKPHDSRIRIGLGQNAGQGCLFHWATTAMNL